MIKKLVDANVILRYLVRDDEALYGKAFDILEKAKVGKEAIEISESVLAELVYVLLKIYGVDRATIAEKLSELFSYKGISNPGREDLVDAIKMFGQTNLSIVDCLLCAKAINQGMVLLTFDEELHKLYTKKTIIQFPES